MRKLTLSGSCTIHKQGGAGEERDFLSFKRDFKDILEEGEEATALAARKKHV